MIPLPDKAPIGKKWVKTGWASWQRSVLVPDDLREIYWSAPFLGQDYLLTGEWSPRTSYFQAKAIECLLSPAMQEHLSRVLSMATGPFRLPDPSVLQATYLSVPTLLAIQARYHIAERHDVQAAAGCIRTILKLAVAAESGGGLGCLGGCAGDPADGP